MTTDARTYRPDLDGLRALAVGAVLVHHVAPGVWPGGFAGVDVFFVLSGFLITGLIAADQDGPGFSWAEFLVRRARRLLPALALVLATCLVAGAALLTAAEYVGLARQTAAAVASAANVLFAAEVGYFDTAAGTKPLLHLWSLGVEEQFYLLWPPTLLLLARRRHGRVGGAALLAMLSLAAALHLAPREPGQAFYLLHTRAWELLAGGMLALARHDRLLRPVAGSLAERLSWAGAALLVVGLVTPDPLDAWPSPVTLLPVAGTTLLIAAGPEARINRVVLASRGAVWLGLRSYPLYLWHWPLLVGLRLLAPDLGLTDATTATVAWVLGAVAILLADLTFRYVERPLQRRVIAAADRGVRRGRLLLPFGATLAVLATAAVVIVRLDGVPTRYGTHASDETAILARASHDTVRIAVEGPSTRCVSADETRQNSWCFRTTARPRVAVFGDSHAFAVFGALASTRADHGIMLVGRLGCAPTISDPLDTGDSTGSRNRARCRRAVRRALELIEAAPDVKTVVLAARGAYYVDGRSFGGTSGLPILPIAIDPAHPDAQRLARLFEDGLVRTITRLRATGRRVVLVADWPELDFDPRTCVVGRPFGIRAVRTPCAVPYDTAVARAAHYRGVLERVAARGGDVAVHDAAAPLCNGRRCIALAGDTLLYVDDNHLSKAGAMRALASLMDVVMAPPVVAAGR